MYNYYENEDSQISKNNLNLFELYEIEEDYIVIEDLSERWLIEDDVPLFIKFLNNASSKNIKVIRMLG